VRPAKDSVGTRVVLFELPFGDIEGWCIKDGGASDSVNGENAQCVPLFIPGVEIPGFAVVGNPLRGNCAL
jgi:hypothetical protein